MVIDVAKLQKQIKKFKKKKSKEKGIMKSLSKKVTPSKRILKKGQMTVKIPEYKAPSILGDPNRFFKNEWEETKKSMFLK